MTEDTRERWWQTPVGRRNILRGAALTGLGAAAAGMVGCGDDDDDADETPGSGGGETPAPTATPAPKRGGVLRGAQTADLNMSTGYPFVFLAENPFLNYLPVEPIVRYVDSLEPELHLAERFEFNADRSGLVVTLKPGLTFHNGAPVTVDDLKFGIDLIKDPAAFGIKGAFQLAAFAKAVTESKIVSDREIEFKFDKPRVNMADFFVQLPVVHRASYDETKSGKAINGTGPFKFKQWTPGQSLTFERNANWHGAASGGGPYLDGVEVRFFGDQDAAGLAYQSGEIDLLLGPPAALAADNRKLVHIAPKTGLDYLGINVSNPQLTDARVRQAIFLAVDRQRVVDELREGLTEVTSQPWPKSSPAFDPALEDPMFDQAKAKKLLSEAGWKQTDPIPLDHRTSAAYVTAAALIQQNLKDVGIETTLIPSDPTAFLAILRERKFKGFWITSHSFSHLAPLTNLQQTLPYQEKNMSYYETPTYLDIRAKLENLDPLSAEAKAQYKRFNEIWVQDPWLVPLAPNSGPQLVSEKVRGYGTYLTAPTNAPDFSKVWLD
ncbi:MAG TPA: ABC transporter substrate-binding protein [Tepidiformaceae bacterium]|nr:ABC transporter substrate-binding protein [Tepidiformaceae bacterium]